jgi:peptide/nickel transport system substrate-binding protein
VAVSVLHVGRRARIAAALGGGALLLAGCASNSSSGGGGVTSSAGTPVRGGTYTYDMQIAPQCADPEVSPQFATYQLSRPVVDSLVASTDGKTFKPWLAKSWTVSPDAKRYTFVLRDDVTFSDGTRLDAQAVKTNFDRIYAPATKSQYARTLLGPYAGTTVVNPTTVTVSFTTGFNSFLAAAATANLGIQSPAALAKNPPCSPAVGSGPFTITAFNAQQGATLSNRPDYRWGPGTAKNTGAAYLSKIVMNFVSNPTTRTGSLTSGQVQGIEAPPTSQIASLTRQGFQLIQHVQPGGVYNMYVSQKAAPLRDERVRQALRDAIDVPGIITALYSGVYKPAWSPIAQGTPGFNPEVVNSWKPDVAQAGKLLDEAGYSGRNKAGFRVDSAGHELDVVLNSLDVREQRQDLGLLIKQAEAKVGINVKIDTDASAQGAIITGNFGLTASAHVESSPDILRLLFHSKALPALGGFNYGQVSDLRLDAWLDQATGSLDPTTQDSLYGKVQQYVVDHALVIPLYQEQTLNAVSSRLHGVTFDATGYVLYYDAWLS